MLVDIADLIGASVVAGKKMATTVAAAGKFGTMGMDDTWYVCRLILCHKNYDRTRQPLSKNIDCPGKEANETKVPLDG